MADAVGLHLKYGGDLKTELDDLRQSEDAKAPLGRKQRDVIGIILLYVG